MKRLLLLLSLVAATIIFSACGSEETVYEPYEPIYEESYEEIYEPQYEYAEIEGVYRRIMPRGSLTIEHFLEDLDYMVYVLENNFALLDVAYWAHGIDYRQLAQQARSLVLEMDEPCEDTFSAIVIYSFLPLFRTGNFTIFSLDSLEEHQQTFRRYTGVKHTMNMDLTRSPLANRFYGSEDQYRRNTFARKIEELIETYGMPFNRTFGAVPQPVVTEIIEAGRIAYVSTGHSSAYLWDARHKIFDFKQQVSNYQHLILDLRENTGGGIGAFLDILLRPHLREDFEAPMVFQFFMDAPYINRFGDLLLQPTIGSFDLMGLQDPRRAHEILEEFNLPEINLDDMARLDYGAPSRRDRPIIPNRAFFPEEYIFDGNIWLLTDQGTTAASTLFAWYAQELEFATIVGDRTGGVVGGPRTMSFMPNTGIIFQFDVFYLTDSRGRPLEAGVIPHHFNREGMDALETTLALIYEGEW
ncbi:MAG: S41 family peptidase [Defluviitaleaceae bacterium]|nr:S41 family peptidase [Defluviitaleaceae bacterium]